MELKGLAKVPWDSVFARFLLEKKYGNVTATHTSSYWIKRIIRYVLYPSIAFDQVLIGSRIVFFSSFTGRKSIVDNFLKVRSIVQSDIIIKSDKHLKIDIINAFRLLYLAFFWNQTLKRYNLNRADRYSMVLETLGIVRLHDVLSKLKVSDYNLLVTFNDSFTLESYAVEYFRLYGIKTATLQHGQFVSWRADTFFDCGIEFRTFKSDYFLCWNKYTYDEAVKFGIATEKLIITGIWSYIGTHRTSCRQNDNGVFGVVISHPSWESENSILIKAANLISSKYGLKYYLKLHPNYPEDAYVNQVNEKYIGNVKKGIPMLEYANLVDFSLIGSSSVFTELVYIEHDVYRYSSGLPNDKYEPVKKGKYFTSVEDLEQKFDELYKMPVSSELFDYLCSVTDVTESYKCFFEQFK